MLDVLPLCANGQINTVGGYLCVLRQDWFDFTRPREMRGCRRRDAAVLKRKAVSRITVGAEKRQLISIFKMGYSWASRPLGSSEKMISFCLLIFPLRCIDALCKYVADIQIWMCECVVVDELRAGLVIHPQTHTHTHLLSQVCDCNSVCLILLFAHFQLQPAPERAGRAFQFLSVQTGCLIRTKPCWY